MAPVSPFIAAVEKKGNRNKKGGGGSQGSNTAASGGKSPLSPFTRINVTKQRRNFVNRRVRVVLKVPLDDASEWGRIIGKDLIIICRWSFRWRRCGLQWYKIRTVEQTSPTPRRCCGWKVEWQDLFCLGALPCQRFLSFGLNVYNKVFKKSVYF